jgi:hypothetical protein
LPHGTPLAAVCFLAIAALRAVLLSLAARRCKVSMYKVREATDAIHIVLPLLIFVQPAACEF